jgi:AcrR family transcriptional regulator
VKLLPGAFRETYQRSVKSRCTVTRRVDRFGGGQATHAQRTANFPALGDDRENAILATAEQLLSERSPTGISINDLACGAGVSRPAYFYLASKDAVLLTLLDRVIEEVNTAASHVLDDHAADPATGWQQSIRVFHDTFRRHRAINLATAQVRGTNNEVRRQWATVMEDWTCRTAAAIEAERGAGRGPDRTVCP